MPNQLCKTCYYRKSHLPPEQREMFIQDISPVLMKYQSVHCCHERKGEVNPPPCVGALLRQQVLRSKANA